MCLKSFQSILRILMSIMKTVNLMGDLSPLMCVLVTVMPSRYLTLAGKQKEIYFTDKGDAMTYATEQQMELAAELGYTRERSPRNGDSFNKGNRDIWAIQKGWQTADLIDGYYQNHQPFYELELALNRQEFKTG